MQLVWRCTIKAICIRSIRIEFAVWRWKICSSSSSSSSSRLSIKLKLYQVKAVVTTTSNEWMHAEYHVTLEVWLQHALKCNNKKKISYESLWYNPKQKLLHAVAMHRWIVSVWKIAFLHVVSVFFFNRTRYSSQYVSNGERFCVPCLLPLILFFCWCSMQWYENDCKN